MKKELTKTLALGALMAFVITGHAWAAEETSDAIIADNQNISREFDALHVTGENVGVKADGYKITLSGNQLTVASNGASTFVTGFYALDGGYIKADVAEAITIKATEKVENMEIGVYGMFVNDARIENYGKKINIAAEVTADADIRGFATGISVSSKSAVTIGSTQSEEITVTATVNGNTNANNSSAFGIYAGDSEVTVQGKKITLTVDGGKGDGYGIYVLNGYYLEEEPSNVTIGSAESQVTIDAKGGLSAYGVTVTANERGIGVATIDGSSINIAAESDGMSYGIKAASDETGETEANNKIIIGNADSEVTITSKGGDESYGVYANGNFPVNIEVNKLTVQSSDVGIAAFNESEVNLSGDLFIEAPTVINAAAGSTTNINAEGGHSAVLSGDIVFGDEDMDEKQINADVNITLQGGESVWTGRSYQMWEEDSDIVTSVALDAVQGFKLAIDDGAAWNVTGDSFVNDLLLNDGFVNLGAGVTVNVGSLSGGRGTVSVSGADNKFVIENSNTIDRLTATTSQAYAEELAGDDMSGAAQSVVNQIVYEKATTTTKTAATDVYIPASSITGAYTADVNEDGIIVNGREAVNEANAGIGDLAGLALMAWRAENNDMNKRLGELRASEGEHGVWVRMTRGESKYKGVKNQYNTYQLGYDEKLSSDKRWTVGAAFSYTDGESGLSFGNGENKHKGLALYGSRLNDDGSFIDLIARYARLEHDFDIRGGAGSGDYSADGYSLSAEYGKRFTQDNGVWLEPQVELTYGHVSGANYVSDKGIRVRQDAMDSVVGRLGLSVGKNIERGNIYARASYLYDFDGDTSLRFSNEKVAREIGQDIGGGWWEVGVGANLKLGKDTHFYVDVEKTYGGDVSTPWQWNAGLRYSF